MNSNLIEKDVLLSNEKHNLTNKNEEYSNNLQKNINIIKKDNKN